MDGREQRGQGDGGRGWNARGEWRGGGGRGDRRENRARLGFAMTNGRRGHSARRSYRSKRDYIPPRWTLSVECLLSSPGSPHPSSARILRLPRFSDSGRRAAPYFPFVRAIYRPASPPPPPSVSFRLSSIVSLRLECDIYLSLRYLVSYIMMKK